MDDNLLKIIQIILVLAIFMAASGSKDLRRVPNLGYLTNSSTLSSRFLGSGGSFDLRCSCKAIDFCFNSSI